MTVIRIQEVTKQFGDVAAVSDASFEVMKGEVIGFVGANGAGKSTTINMLLGFIAPSHGTVRVFGETVTPHVAHRQHARMGFAAGDMELPGNLTSKQYLQFLTHQYGGDTAKRLAELTERFQPVLHKKIATLSRGNKQKIALIAAFLPSPELVILDEPTSGLDPIMQEKFLELIRGEAAAGTTIFMSSHYLGEVADVCSRVILMRDGRIVSDTPAAELLRASGKHVRVISGYGRTAAPKGAEAIAKSKTEDGGYVVEFDWRGEPAQLQQWLAAVKQLRDIEVTEFNLEAAFRGMYDEESAA